MAGVGTNSAELRAIKKTRSKLVTAIAKQGGLNWFSQKLQEHDFITLERASSITNTLGVSDEDKVSSLLEAVEAKIKSNRQGTPFSDFVKMLEGEGCLQDIGQTLQLDRQRIEEASRSDDVVSGQIATSMSEAKPSVSIRDSPADSSGDVTTVPSSNRPAPFPGMQSVDGSGQVYVPLREENENTIESNTDVADGEEIAALHEQSQMGRQPVDDSAPSSMVQQTSTLTRAEGLHEYDGAELSAISSDVTSQISNLKEQLQKHLQQEEKQEKQINDLTEEKKKLEAVVQEKTEELTQTQGQLAEKACKLEECEQKLNLERQTKEQLQQQLDEKKAELESSRKQLANKEREFEKVRSDKEKAIAELREALEEKAKAVKDQEEQVTELKAERKNLQLKLAEKQNELLEVKVELAQKGEKLAKTETEVNQLQSEKKLEELRRSSEEYRRKSEATIALQSAEIAELRKIPKLQHIDEDTMSS